MIYRKTIFLPNPLSRLQAVDPASVAREVAPKIEAPPTPPPPPPVPVDLVTPRLEALVRSLNKVVDEMHDRREKQAKDIREIATELAFLVAEKILGDQVRRFPIEELVREAAGRWSVRGVLKLYLHPDDLELLKARVTPETILPDRHVQWFADSTVRRGDCRLSAGELSMETDWQGWLQEVRQSILEAGPDLRSGD